MGVSLMSLQITRALNDVTGNVAVIFAVLLVPIFAAATTEALPRRALTASWALAAALPGASSSSVV